MHVHMLLRGQDCVIPAEQRPLGAHYAELANDSTQPVKGGVTYFTDKYKEELRKSEPHVIRNILKHFPVIFCSLFLKIK